MQKINIVTNVLPVIFFNLSQVLGWWPRVCCSVCKAAFCRHRAPKSCEILMFVSETMLTKLWSCEARLYPLCWSLTSKMSVIELCRVLALFGVYLETSIKILQDLGTLFCMLCMLDNTYFRVLSICVIYCELLVCFVGENLRWILQRSADPRHQTRLSIEGRHSDTGLLPGSLAFIWPIRGCWAITCFQRPSCGHKMMQNYCWDKTYCRLKLLVG